MDSLLLGFSPEQYKKYLELKSGCFVQLCFDTSWRIFELTETEINGILQKMADESQRLLDCYSRDSFFAPALKKENISSFATTYFDVINNIEASRRLLFERANASSKNILELQKELDGLNSRYLDFLPYKAAFFDSDEHKDEIFRIDNEFKKSIGELKEAIMQTIAHFDTLVLICDKIVPDFYKSTSTAADAPRFKNFNEKEFYTLIEGFIVQTKSI